jgi:hypothetical protein
MPFLSSASAKTKGAMTKLNGEHKCCWVWYRQPWWKS